MNPVAFQFTEDMRGFASAGQTSFDDGYAAGRDSNSPLMFHLTLKTDDLERFLTDKAHEAVAIGYVEGPIVGGRCQVETGSFNLFIEGDDVGHKRMAYRLFFHAGDGRKMTLSGTKEVQDKPGFDVWHDTTTLYTAADVTPRREVALISLPLRGEPRDHRLAEETLAAAQREQRSRRWFRRRSAAHCSSRSGASRTPIQQYCLDRTELPSPLPMSYHRRTVGVLDLEPVPGRARPVGRGQAL